MDYLKNKNKHPRDDHISFDEGPHIYTIDGESDFMSVTTWNHCHFPKFDADKVITNMKLGKNWNENNKYWGMTDDEIKMMWKTSGKESADMGTALHNKIECFYNKMDVEDDDTLEWGYFKKFHQDHINLKPYRTEWMVWDNELKFAGAIDMIFENEDGTLSIYDWKRTKDISKIGFKGESATTKCIEHLPHSKFWHYSLQLNTYKYLLEKNYDKIIKDMYLIRLHPNNKNNTYEKLRVPDLSDEINDLMELRRNTLIK